MGKRGGKRGRQGGFRGGKGANNSWRERTNKADLDRHNDQYESYYNALDIMAADEKQKLWEAMRRDLPNSFRFTGSKAHALAVQQRLKDFYIPEITSITYDGEMVETPKPVNWYPDQLAWYMTTPKHIVRRFQPFASFQKFLVAETDVGNISRQEVVSMIPPLCMDLNPTMTVLDLCAAPGSKSAQLIEMLHGGEEERCRQVAHHLANGLDRPSGEEYEDDGRCPGLLIANDVDYRRAHMLVHQMKRLSSPNLIVTNHDATLYPSIRLPTAPSPEGRPSPKKYLKFDRILADVPCSGDGTCRKNLELWRSWNPGVPLGLHPTQVRILIRALQMLKVGGRVVYSTCSMNPVENEAVLATAIDRCGGPELVEIVDSSGYLPHLKRYPGIRNWKVMDKQGRIWSSWDEVLAQRDGQGIEGLGRLQQSNFSPELDLRLERCMRIYPHLQDTGAFFIAILEKKSEIKAKTEQKLSSDARKTSKEDGLKATQSDKEANVNDSEVDAAALSMQPPVAEAHEERPSAEKRDREEEDAGESSPKRSKYEVMSSEDAAMPLAGGDTAAISVGLTSINPTKTFGDIAQDSVDSSISKPSQSIAEANGMVVANNASGPGGYKVKKSGQPLEEPFKYLNPSLDELKQMKDFYDISSLFPWDRFMVRNASGIPSKNVYYTTALAKSILQENEGKGMKFVHSGVKMFVKQEVPHPEICRWRIQTDGLPIVEPWVGQPRRIRMWRRETLRKLLIEMFPRFNGDEWKKLGEIGEQVKEIGMGCCILQIEPSDDPDSLSERMIFPLWKSLYSLNLMLPKEDRKALLLRLFNDDTPLVNISQLQKGEKTTATRVSRSPGTEPDPIDVPNKRNSSSEDEDGSSRIDHEQALHSLGVRPLGPSGCTEC